MLQQYRGTPYAADLTRAFGKVTAGLPGRVTVDLVHPGAGHSSRTTAASLLDSEAFRDLDAAIRYHSASRDEETARDVDPSMTPPGVEQNVAWGGDPVTFQRSRR